MLSQQTEEDQDIMYSLHFLGYDVFCQLVLHLPINGDKQAENTEITEKNQPLKRKSVLINL